MHMHSCIKIRTLIDNDWWRRSCSSKFLIALPWQSVSAYDYASCLGSQSSEEVQWAGVEVGIRRVRQRGNRDGSINYSMRLSLEVQVLISFYVTL
jgi:hypothetical protein